MVEAFREVKVSKIGWEIVYWLVEVCPKGEEGEGMEKGGEREVEPWMQSEMDNMRRQEGRTDGVLSHHIVDICGGRR